MKFKSHSFSIKALFLTGLFSVLIAGCQSAPQLGNDSIKNVVAAMTLKEKAALVVGEGWSAKNPKVAGAAGQTHAIPRLGIPSMVLSDGPAGVRIKPIRDKDSSKTYYATAFPVARLLASSWDTALVKSVGEAYGEEAHKYGVDVALAPAMNIHRNPLGGRNFEYYSEDPVIAGKIAAAMVRGIQSQGVGTSIKHFVANNQESNRRGVNTLVSERALREIYLKGFEIAVKEAHPWTVMSSYNKLDGAYTSQRRDLITTVLRDEWNFKGFVMTDWGGGDNAVEQMKAGNNLIMPGNKKQVKSIIDAVQSGTLDKKVLDQNVTGILQIILKSPSFKGYDYSNQPDLKAHAKVSRKAAAQSMVLLKNKQEVLPLKQNAKVAAFGNTSYDIIVGGRGSGAVNEAYDVQLSQGLADAGYKLDETLKTLYQNYIKQAKAQQPKLKGFFDHHKPIAEMPVDAAMAQKKANTDDVAIITISKNSGEGADRPESDFALSDKDIALIHTVSRAFHATGKKVVVILNVAGVTEVASWRDQVDGILLAWQPGQEAGHAIADVLSGSVNPSGRLATTFPVKYSDVPSSDNFPGTPEKKPAQVKYKEGIYTGYRYYDSFGVKPAYAFGYGLSYTTFSFDHLELSSTDFKDKITATVDMTNSGSVAGKEVVQLYLSAPGKTMNKPAQELKSFAKTKMLQPGEKQTITFTINSGDLASYNTKTSSWEAEAGKYTVKIGASSRDIRQTNSLMVRQLITVEKDHKVLQPEAVIDEIKP